jgi:hypothetical protein
MHSMLRRSKKLGMNKDFVLHQSYLDLYDHDETGQFENVREEGNALIPLVDGLIRFVILKKVITKELVTNMMLRIFLRLRRG